jgi:xanthine/uracil permease
MTTVNEPVWRTALSGAQILFVAFGATVLVPLLTGLNPSLALLGAGVGTLIFQICTKRQVPIYLGSSFAFIAPGHLLGANLGHAGDPRCAGFGQLSFITSPPVSSNGVASASSIACCRRSSSARW